MSHHSLVYQPYQQMRFRPELLKIRVSANEFWGWGHIRHLSQTKGEVQIRIRLHLFQTSWEQGSLVEIQWILLPSIYQHELVTSLGNSQFFIGTGQSLRGFDLVLVIMALQWHSALLEVRDVGLKGSSQPLVNWMVGVGVDWYSYSWLFLIVGFLI